MSKAKKVKNRLGNGDFHHLCYQRRNWKDGALGELRELDYCKAYIPKNTLHIRIHAEVWDIPTPQQINAKRALEQLAIFKEYGVISSDDSIERRLEVLVFLFEKVDQPTADAFRKQLNIVRKFYGKPPI